ncbi:MAG TPA: helix-turn-helix domain-containing protein [Tepidiformaceae bacterium]|nr:helix-turn-helix domain-containing protein [Tepidiformaceae bacterium]
MSQIGDSLRRARDARSLSLSDIARDTHIPEYLLEALERDDFAAIPAPVYVRGFIRNYARRVGLEPDDLLAQLPPGLRPAEEPALRPASVPLPPAPVFEAPSHPRVAAPPVIRRPRPEPIAQAETSPAPGLILEEAPIYQPSRNARVVIDDEPEPDWLDRPAKPGRRRWGLAFGSAVVLAAATITTTAALTRGGGGDGLPAQVVDEPTATATVETTQAAAGPTLEAATASPTAAPTEAPTQAPTLAPTVAPTATPTTAPAAVAAVTPQVPLGAFAYCTSLGGDTYSCGDSPWRVICTPDGYFFDPTGVIPRPIPAEWTGWSETTLTGRLELVHGVCG